ncbi:MAG: hypothetical protein RSG23_10375, partial [Gordonibacter sp.]
IPETQGDVREGRVSALYAVLFNLSSNLCPTPVQPLFNLSSNPCLTLVQPTVQLLSNLAQIMALRPLASDECGFALLCSGEKSRGARMLWSNKALRRVCRTRGALNLAEAESIVFPASEGARAGCTGERTGDCRHGKKGTGG